MTGRQLAWRIRRHALEMTHLSGSSHIASVFSEADILGVLYAEVLRYDPKDPAMEDRDRFILSKGHAGAGVYAALAECGFFPLSVLKTHYQSGSILSGHVSHKGVPGVEMSTGSLGHGLSAGLGRALAARRDGKDFHVFVLMGDGECDEGSVWEAALFGAHFGLGNVTAIIDHNKMQSLDFCDNTLRLSPFADKWRAFGWNTVEVDGHDHEALYHALTASRTSDKPTVIIAHTVKGKGVSFMENNILWHYRYPHDGEEYDAALAELKSAMPPGTSDPYTE